MPRVFLWIGAYLATCVRSIVTAGMAARHRRSRLAPEYYFSGALDDVRRDHLPCLQHAVHRDARNARSIPSVLF